MSEKKINIPFAGITRNTDDGMCKDGECMELINARIKNGSVEPVGNPILLQLMNEPYSKGFYHALSEKYLFIKESGSTIVSYDKNLTNRKILSDSVTNVSDIQFIGYILSAMTENGIHYFIFKHGEYSYIGQKPEFNISIYSTEEKEITIKKDFVFDKTEGLIPHEMDPRDVPKFLDSMDAWKNEALDPYRHEGRISEPVCIRAALRMYNGVHIAHSPIYIVFPQDKIYSAGYLDDIKSFQTLIDGKAAITVTQKLKTYRIGYTVSFYGISEWEDVITSVDIFMSRPFSIIDAETLKAEGMRVDANILNIKTYSKKALAEKITQTASLLYLSNTVSGGYQEGILKTSDINKELLQDDPYSRNLTSGKTHFTYNGRLHIGNIESRLFKGFSTQLSIDPKYSAYNGYSAEHRLASLKIFTYISTEGGEKIVLNEEPAINPLQPYFCYPDYRANKAVIYAAIANGDSILFRKRSIYLENGNMNMSYFLNYGDRDSISPIDLRDAEVITEAEFNTPPIVVNDIERSLNKMKVSELNNPFYFPAKTTYTPSSGEILAMRSNTASISQGQFGQFPLIVFCSDGIYAMAVGTDVVYTNSSPLSRDVSNNPDGIVSIDNSIVFTSEQGVMILQGSTVQNISKAINGYLPSCIESSPVIGKILSIPNLLNSASAVKFDEYVKACKIGYNYQERELIVSNKSYDYSYVYSIASNQWYKASYSVKAFINRYPETLALHSRDNGIYNLQNNHRTVANIALLSRPTKLGTLTHKRILQSALRGIVKRSISDLYLKGEPVMLRGDPLFLFKDVGFYILGSNDAEHFSLISGTEAIKDIRDIVGKMNKSKSFKYFMFAFVGGVRTDVSINYIELIADESFNNRLR